MSAPGRLSAVRLATWLPALLLVLCCTSCSSPESASATATVSKNYDHFLLLRQDLSPDRRTATQTLVEARLTPEGLAYRDICQRWGLHFLDVFAGNLYALDGPRLVAIGLSSGKSECLNEEVDSSSRVYAAGTLVWVTEAGQVRVCEVPAGTHRELATLPSDKPRGQLTLSPNGKRLAFFLPASEVMNGPAQLQVIDLEDGEWQSVGEPVSYQPLSKMIASVFEVGPPLVWVDDRTVLFLQTPDLRASNGPLLNHDEVRVITADAVSGMVRKVCVVPEQSRSFFYGLSRPTAQSGPVLLVGERAYSIDLQGGALTEGVSLGGGFRLEPAQTQTETGAPFLCHEERKLGQARVANWPVLSPDAKKVIWIGAPSYGVHCYDADGDVVREVDPGFVQDEFLWFAEEDLTSTMEASNSTESE